MSYPEPRYHDDSGLTTAIETRTRRPTAEAASQRGRAARSGSRGAAAAGASRALATNRPLALLGLSMLATLAAALVGLVADPRVITGAPAWLKPAKFAISTAIYAFTPTCARPTSSACMGSR